MKAILAIAAAHFRQEGKVALLSLGAGVAVLGLVALGDRVPESVLDALGPLGGFVPPSVIAVLMGMNLLGPDVRQRRLSFYFSRPCAPWQLWCGRFLGAVLVLAVSFVGGMMALVPFVEPVLTAKLLGSLLLFLLLATNAATCILLSFSLDALVFDLVAGTAVAASTFWTVKRFLELVGDPGTAFGLGLWVPCAAALALVPASLAYLWGGRGRARWGHRWFSWTFWPIVALSVAGINVWRMYEARRPLPEVLRYPAWSRSLDEKRILLTGWAYPYSRWYVVNVETGASERVSALNAGRVVSSNGEFVAWNEFDIERPSKDEFSLVVARTASIGQPLRKTKTLSLVLDISADGEWALLAADEALEIKDTHTGGLVGRFPLAASYGVWSARFVDKHSLEATLWEESEFRRVTFAPDGKLLQEERLARPRGARLVEHALTGRRAVIEQTQTVLYDREGKPLGTFVGPNQSTLFTRDGTLLVSSTKTVTVQGEGTPSKTLSVAGNQVDLFGELSTGEVVVRSVVGGTPSTLLVDPQTLTVRATFEGVGPVRTMREYNGRAGSTAHDTALRLFQNEDGDLLYLDRGATKLRPLIKSTREDF